MSEDKPAGKLPLVIYGAGDPGTMAHGEVEDVLRWANEQRLNLASLPPGKTPQQAAPYSLEFHPTNPPRPMAIWSGDPGDGGRLVANLRDANATMAEANAMAAALNARQEKAQ